MVRGHRGELAVGTLQCEHADIAGRLFDQGKMHGVLVAPQAEHGRVRVDQLLYGEPRGPSHKAKGSYVPMFAHLGLVLSAGIYLPAPLVAWFQNVARLLG